MKVSYVQCIDSDSFYAFVDDLYEIIYIKKDDGLVWIGFKDYSMRASWMDTKAQYVVEYEDAVNKNVIASWKDKLTDSSNPKLSVSLNDLHGFLSSYQNKIKSFGLGTSLPYITKLIGNILYV